MRRSRTRQGLLALSPFALVLGLSLIVFRAYWIPSGSMKPSLLVGDYVVSNRLAYGFPALFCDIGMCRDDMGPLGRYVARGDVATFRHPVTGHHFVKRIIGLPGETVQMIAGNVVLAGAVLDAKPDGLFSEVYTLDHGYLACLNAPIEPGDICTKARFRERLPEGRGYHILHLDDRTVEEDTKIFEVPAGHVFVMGDNRDNSIDSRVAREVGGLGFVPLHRMVGRVDLIIMSLVGEEGRVFKRVP